MNETERVAERHGLEVGWGQCQCGHGLLWHDNLSRTCGFSTYRDGLPTCTCPRFEEAEWSALRQPKPR